MSDDPLTLPARHDAAQYLSPKWKRRQAELARKVRQSDRLRMKRLHGKVQSGGLVGGFATVAMITAETLSPGMLMSLGISSPIAGLITAAASFAGGYLKSTTQDDLPTDVQTALTAMETQDTTWNDVVDHFEPQLRAIGKEGLQSLAEIVQDENGQKLVVAAANNDIDVPWLTEGVEGIAMDQAYNAIQFGVGQLAAKGLELLDFDDDTG